MNHKAQGPNGRPAGSPADDEVIADLVIACDEALRRGTDWPNETAKFAELDPKVRERLASAKDCLQLIERVRQFRQTETQELPTGAAAALLHDNAYTAGGAIHRIGRFEIIRELGRGSHGVVFLARDPGLNREIALKVPRPEAILTPQLRSRFLREGKASARLNHPNILPVHEAGEAGPICYLVQSYCSGLSLSAWLVKQTNPVPCELAARIVSQLADGVDHAHKQGVLHRDIKPANVMLQPLVASVADAASWPRGSDSKIPHPDPSPTLREGLEQGTGDLERGHREGEIDFTPKLADFGLAKSLDDDPNTTATFGTLGTAVYMPPEQAAGQLSLVGPRSDVYSLGALLYELLTRRLPIVGANQLETLRLIASVDPQPIRGLRSDVPSELEAICLKCLEKSPDQRYPTAAELAADLRRFLDGESVLASPVGKIRRTVRRLRRLPLSVLLGLAAIGLLTGGLVLSMLANWSNRHEASVGNVEPRAINPEAEYLGGMESVAQGYFDAVANRGDVKTAVRELDAFLERHHPRPGQSDYRGFEWHYLWRLCHPDQVAKKFPKLFDLVGHNGEVYFVTFSPDGRRIATAGQDHTGRIWDAATGKLVANLIGHTDDVNWISFYPEAGINHVLTASDDKTVRIWDCEDGKLESVLEDGAPVVAVEIARSLYPEQPDQILTCDDLGQLRVWDWVSRRLMRTIPAHSQRIHALTPIRGRNWWLTASSDGTVKEWDYLNWVPMGMHVVDSVDFRGASASIFSASCNTQATLAAFGWGWSAITGRAGLAPAPSRDLSGNMQQGSVTIDDLLTGTRWLQLTGAAAFCYECVRFYPGQCALVSTCRDKTSHGGSEYNVVYWDLPTQKFWNPFDGIHPPSWCAAFASDGTRMATAGNDGTVRVWDSSMLPGGKRLDSLDGGLNKPPRTARFSPDGRRLLVTYAGDQRPNHGHSFVIWDVSGPRAKPIYLEPTHGDLCGSLSGCFSRDGRLIAVDTTERSGQKSRSRIRLLDAESMREIRRFEGYENFARRIFVSPDGKYIVAVTGDWRGLHEQLNVWKADSSTPATVFPESGQPPQCLATTLSPDGKLLATSRGRVQIYNFPSLRLSSTLPFGLGSVGALRFSPDGQILAAGGDGGTIHLWDRGSGEELATLRSDGHAVLSLAFSPDGTRLAVGLDGAARVDVWHVPTRKRLTPLAMPTDLASVTDLNFSPDQRTLAAVGAGGNGGVFLFPLEPVDTLAMKRQP
jgi:WD40 repeat protein/serine/threonine protein kinase